MANNERGRKLLIRSAMVTGTTIATLVGTSNLAMLDARALQATLTPSNTANEVALITEAAPQSADTDIMNTAPGITILHTAPSITVLRQSSTTQQVASANNSVIQPPVPAEIAPPDPIIQSQPNTTVQQSAPQANAPVVQNIVSPRTRSSR